MSAVTTRSIYGVVRHVACSTTASRLVVFRFREFLCAVYGPLTDPNVFKLVPAIP